MNAVFVFLWMVFFHIIDDFYIQAAWLSSGKQKSWWEENCKFEMYKYKYDYICALIMHSISWTFMIMLPIAYSKGFEIDSVFVVIFIVNVALHACCDNLKANYKKINLWHDQLFHLVQILATFTMVID